MDREQAAAVQRMQDFIDDHLTAPISMRQLADAAGYSPSHAAHIFKELTGDAPFDYLRRKRLSAAALRLRDGDDRVIDVALDFLFNSHEGFTRAFHREFGLPPKRYQQQTPPVWLYQSYSSLDYYQHLHSKEALTMAGKVTTQLIDFPDRKILLKRAKHAADYFAYCDEVGCDVWGLLVSVKEALNEPMGLWLPESMRAGGSEYAQGVQLPADYAGEVPEGFSLIDAPACRMLVFQGEPYDDASFGAAIAAATEAIDAFDPATIGYRFATDEQPRFQFEPQGWRGYIEGRPVRPLDR